MCINHAHTTLHAGRHDGHRPLSTYGHTVHTLDNTRLSFDNRIQIRCQYVRRFSTDRRRHESRDRSSNTRRLNTSRRTQCSSRWLTTATRRDQRHIRRFLSTMTFQPLSCSDSSSKRLMVYSATNDLSHIHSCGSAPQLIDKRRHRLHNNQLRTTIMTTQSLPRQLPLLFENRVSDVTT